MALMNIFAHYIFYAASGGEYNPKGLKFEGEPDDGPQDKPQDKHDDKYDDKYDGKPHNKHEESFEEKLLSLSVERKEFTKESIEEYAIHIQKSNKGFTA